ncbi:hypothetical protein PROFUN_13537 [Planoprotostelium fungivorum]|uniref:Uncharacterized protein n=1 Tax=Planoprotostelium fungivorum TaxID=1890364 RepID=A0A2P6N3Q5_9EUKA|nr:hypothetical protein PROFUN_13537 [Planoprotostelium fungivorum]
MESLSIAGHQKVRKDWIGVGSNNDGVVLQTLQSSGLFVCTGTLDSPVLKVYPGQLYQILMLLYQQQTAFIKSINSKTMSE